MTIPMLVTWSLSILALSMSTYALLVARRSSDRSLRKAFSALSEQLSELVEGHEALTLALRQLRARLNMAAGRARKANGETQPDQDTRETDPEAAKDRWTREMNLKIANGEVRIPGRR